MIDVRVVIIDNYDSFSYNLYQYIGEFAKQVDVVKNDEYTCEQIEERYNPTHIVISPGPGRPSDAGICEEACLYFKGVVPILGVCLGHQAICEAFGGKIVYAKRLMHGKSDTAYIAKGSPIFKGLPEKIKVARYHSLAVSDLPESFDIIATTGDEEIMAVKLFGYDVYGLQFHPESIMTEHGKQIIKNFLSL
jgi:anthranilate synthase component 2